MDININPGKYVIAVSGGVDSVVLLDYLTKKYLAKINKTEFSRNIKGNHKALSNSKDYNFIVAHFDHGIRTDSLNDRLFVQKLTKKYDLVFVYQNGNLGTQASEELARDSRYRFLRKILKDFGGFAIITAHQQDDVIETLIFNTMRGTGRLGISSLNNQPPLIRPMLNVSKKEIIDYANKNKLIWREDSTNKQLKYKRNYIRQKIVSGLNDDERELLFNIYKKQLFINQEIDSIINEYLLGTGSIRSLNRYFYNCLPYVVSTEILASWLRLNHIRDFDRKYLEILAVKLKTLEKGKKMSLGKKGFIEVEKEYLALSFKER